MASESHKPLAGLAGPLYGKEPWPLRFHSHGFGAACFNTLACSIIYNRHQFGTRRWDGDDVAHDRPSGPLPFENWRDEWDGSHSILPFEGRTFPGPVDIEWFSLDGESHALSIDLDEMFRGRLVLHFVKRGEVKEAWLDAKSVEPVSPDILVEVNDRSVSVYMRAFVATEAEQMPGNDRSHFRNDLVLVWNRTC